MKAAASADAATTKIPKPAAATATDHQQRYMMIRRRINKSIYIYIYIHIYSVYIYIYIYIYLETNIICVKKPFVPTPDSNFPHFSESIWLSPKSSNRISENSVCFWDIDKLTFEAISSVCPSIPAVKHISRRALESYYHRRVPLNVEFSIITIQ